MRIGSAQLKLSRNHGERFLAPGYVCAPRAEWLCRYGDTMLPKRAHVWYKGDDVLWWLGKLVPVRRRMGYTWPEFWTIRGPIKLLVFPVRYTTPRGPYEVFGAYSFT